MEKIGQENQKQKTQAGQKRTNNNTNKQNKPAKNKQAKKPMQNRTWTNGQKTQGARNQKPTNGSAKKAPAKKTAGAKGKNLLNKSVKKQDLMQAKKAENRNNINLINKKRMTNYTAGGRPSFNKTAPRKGLNVMFFGGVGEIGKNCMALEYGNEIIIVDCGSIFPDENTPGVDLILPDFSYLVSNKNKIKGIVITHGHEDHIGSLPFFLKEVNVPIYGSNMAMALVQKKMKEHPKTKAKLKTVKARQTISLGKNFKIEFIKVNHSIAGAFALAITTPEGVMVHTGDFKIDYTPIDGDVIDLKRFEELGKQGVMLLTSESTNVERDGFSMSESKVGEALDVLFDKYDRKRILITTFASNIYRIQQIVDLAKKYNRKIAFTGRSMKNVSEISLEIGELKMDPTMIVPLDKIKKYADDEILIVSTGSQGEPMAALTRMSAGNFKQLSLGPNDVVIFSSSPIPGNEKGVNRTINNLYKRGCEIIYSDLADVHVSGHACRGELNLIQKLVKPKYFVPVHGEYRHLKKHRDLALDNGVLPRNSVIAEIGSRVEVTKKSIRLAGTVPAGNVLLDGLGQVDAESVVLRDRKHLSEDGMCLVVLGIDSLTGDLTSGPDIISKGFIYEKEMGSLIREAKSVVIKTVQGLQLEEGEWSIVRDAVRRALRNLFFKKTKRRPMVITMIVEN